MIAEAAIAQARRDDPGAEGHLQAMAAGREAARWTGRAGDPAAARGQLAQLLPVKERALGPDHRSAQATRDSLEKWARQAAARRI